jgi:UDP-N-acetylglucosamine--N-acetylmuramyl-(pentapeptide) pyrophosphoryl-undecaprenol N-acetylglucosamine transferase
MKIVAAGGGSGGHVTPILAVLAEIKRLDPELKSYVITDHKFGPQAHDIIKSSPVEIKLKRIYAGKLRRYHNVSVVRQLFDIPTLLKNIRDIFLVGVGLLQSIFFLWKTKPDVVFTKGGFVCLPVGLAAKILRLPLVIHDSDAHPGLTNRILAGSARVIATGAPVENYSYPEGRTHYVGIPVSRSFRPLTLKQQQACKAELGLHDTQKPLLVVTGGGLGARNINRAVVTIAPHLLDKIAILHITGQANYQEVSEKAPEHIDYLVKPFLPEGLVVAFGAADVVMTRAGATTMVELASMGKPTIIIPAPHLTGGHQLKNADVYEKADAAIVLQEEDIILDQRVLLKALADLFGHIEKRRTLARNLHRFSRPDAALDLAGLIVEAAATKKAV